MVEILATFSGFSVDDISRAKTFYGTTLQLPCEDQPGGTLLTLPGGSQAWMYEKPDHQPAGYTMLNLVVADIDAAHDDLSQRGVVFEHYPDSYQDDRGVMRGKEYGRGPNIAWFKDPAGNILSIVER